VIARDFVMSSRQYSILAFTFVVHACFVSDLLLHFNTFLYENVNAWSPTEICHRLGKEKGTSRTETKSTARKSVHRKGDEFMDSDKIKVMTGIKTDAAFAKSVSSY